MARSHFGSPSIAGSILWKGREAERGIWANLDGNTRIEAREARFHGEQKRNGPQWPRVKSAHSSFFRAFSALFSLLSNGWGWAVGWGAWCVGTCEECDTKNRLPARYSSETDVLFPARLRNREPIESAPDSY